MKDILLDENDDLMIEDGDFVAGESLTQEVSLILRMNQGELKEDPILGPGLIRLINSGASRQKLTDLVKKHLARDGKDFEALKKSITVNNKSL